MDTKGPEIRTGTLRPGKQFIDVRAAGELLLTTKEDRRFTCDDDAVFVDYPDLAKAVKETKTIFIDDGVLHLDVISVNHDGTEIRCKARNCFHLTSQKGVNLPGACVTLPALSEKDRLDLGFAARHNLDFIFASFIRSASDVLEVRQALATLGAPHIKIVAKIENQQGLDNFDEILKASDGIMVARGDLGIEIPAEKVFIAQKAMIAKCNLAGKPVICATQMLESMTTQPRPTRAEASDVANAVLDGADCVMLSGETAKGEWPIASVEMMSRIAFEAESSIAYFPLYQELRGSSCCNDSTSKIIATSAVNASLERSVQAIIVLTRSGETAQLIAKYRPRVPIICVSRSDRVARQLLLSWGCFPMQYRDATLPNWTCDVEARILWAIVNGKHNGLLVPGKFVIVVQGWKGGPGNTNSMRLQLVE